MKKIKILLPLLTITTPLISMVSCKGNIDESIKLDITCQDEHIKVKSQPNETKLNHTIIVEYSIDADYIEDIIIRCGINTITYDCLINKETKEITIPAEQVIGDITILLNANPSYKWVFNDTNHVATLKKYYGNETNISIPSSIEKEGTTYSVTTIGEGCFGSSSNAVNVVLPDSVTTIEQFAFNGAKKLENITLSHNLKSIGYNAFQGTSITSIEIFNGIETIESNAFYSCSKLTEATIGSGITTLPTGLFYSCKNLTTVTLPDTIGNLSQGLFNDCTSLDSIICPILTLSWYALERPEATQTWHKNVPSSCLVYLYDGAEIPIDEA